jgi:hypothetical protein
VGAGRGEGFSREREDRRSDKKLRAFWGGEEMEEVAGEEVTDVIDDERECEGDKRLREERAERVDEVDKPEGDKG